MGFAWCQTVSEGTEASRTPLRTAVQVQRVQNVATRHAGRRCAAWIIKPEQALAVVSVGERDDDVSVRLNKTQTHNKSATSFTYGPGCGCGVFNTKTLITMRICENPVPNSPLTQEMVQRLRVKKNPVRSIWRRRLGPGGASGLRVLPATSQLGFFFSQTHGATRCVEILARRRTSCCQFSPSADRTAIRPPGSHSRDNSSTYRAATAVHTGRRQREPSVQVTTESDRSQSQPRTPHTTHPTPRWSRGPLALGLERHARRIRLPPSLVPPSGLRGDECLPPCMGTYGGGGPSALIGR